MRSKDKNVKKILFIDDEPEFANPQAEALEEIGYDITMAIDYDEALEYLNKSEYDLIILDLLIPPSEVESTETEEMVEVGLKLYEYIRVTKRMTHLPIIFLTVVRDTDIVSKLADRERAYGHKLNHLPKPARPTDVVRNVKETFLNYPR
jgi:CheY-like chemotaxis protein